MVMARARPSVRALSKNAVSPTPTEVMTEIARYVQESGLTLARFVGSPRVRATGTSSTLPTPERMMLREKAENSEDRLRAIRLMSVQASAVPSAARTPTVGLAGSGLTPGGPLRVPWPRTEQH